MCERWRFRGIPERPDAGDGTLPLGSDAWSPWSIRRRCPLSVLAVDQGGHRCQHQLRLERAGDPNLFSEPGTLAGRMEGFDGRVLSASVRDGLPYVRPQR